MQQYYNVSSGSAPSYQMVAFRSENLTNNSGYHAAARYNLWFHWIWEQGWRSGNSTRFPTHVARVRFPDSSSYVG